MKLSNLLVILLVLAALVGCDSGGQVANPGSSKAAEMGSSEAQSTGTVIQRTEPGGDK